MFLTMQLDLLERADLLVCLGVTHLQVVQRGISVIEIRLQPKNILRRS